jgi:hypothetical protein
MSLLTCISCGDGLWVYLQAGPKAPGFELQAAHIFPQHFVFFPQLADLALVYDWLVLHFTGCRCIPVDKP